MAKGKSNQPTPAPAEKAQTEATPTPAPAEKAGAAEPDAKAYVVVERFRDALNRRRVYEAGEDVSHLDEARLESLLEKGLVKKQ